MSFKDFMFTKGYYRYQGVWYFNKIVLSGKELSDLLNEYKEQLI